MIVDLSAAKNATAELSLGIDAKGFDFSWALVSREGVIDTGDAFIPKDHPETGKAIVHRHDKAIIAFGNISTLVRNAKPMSILYSEGATELSIIIPIIAAIESLQFAEVSNVNVAMCFGGKHKSQVTKLIRDKLKLENPLTVERAAAIAYATYGVKLRAKQITQELQKTASGLYI